MNNMALIRLLPIVFFLFVMSACEMKNSELNEYMNKCITNSFMFAHKALVVEERFSSFMPLEDYFAIKHGATSEPFYMLTLVGIKGGKGLILYMDDTMLEPKLKEIRKELSNEIIQEGKAVFGENVPNFRYKNIHDVPCYFINFDSKGKNYAFVGRAVDENTKAFLRKIEGVSLSLEKGRLDKNEEISISYSEHKNTIDDVFKEIQRR